MRLRVQDIPLGGRTVEGGFDAGWVDANLDGAARGVPPGVVVTARVERVGPTVLLQGRCEAEFVLDCARCLCEVREEVALSFTHVLEQRPDADELDGDLELEDGDLDVSYIDGPEFDVDDIVREHLLLALPLVPVCRDDCRGLCPSCGANLNAAECRCTAPMDPRWAKLKALKV